MSNRFSVVLGRAWNVVVCAGGLAGCADASSLPREEVSEIGGFSEEAFDHYRDHHVHFSEASRRYVVEGDLQFGSLEEVRQYFMGTYASRNALTLERHEGADSIWPYAQKRSLTYCVSTGFGANYATVRDAMLAATASWENVADVRFVHASAHDASCDYQNNGVVFDVVPDMPGEFSTGLAAVAFFPDMPRSQRELTLNVAKCTNDPPRTLVGILTHELGHVLGFKHEHIHGSTSGSCAELADSTWRQLTPYDPLSVMHYPSCAGSQNPNDFLISERDAEGATAIYDAPTNVVSTYGHIFARKMSNGALYRRESNGTWRYLATRARQLVGIGSTLYMLAAGGNTVMKVENASNTWYGIGSPNYAAVRQIFRCLSSLCATSEPTGDVYRHDAPSATWVKIGGPGRKFASSDQGLIGQTPNGQQLWKYTGDGWQNSWALIGGPFEDIGGGRAALFAIEAGSGNIVRMASDAAAPTVIAGRHAQVFAPKHLGTSIFALTLDRSAVMTHNGWGWTQIGGPAVRLYQDVDISAALIATNPANFDLYRFDLNTGAWINLGQP